MADRRMTISLGLLNVPVRIEPVVREQASAFHQVHRGCGGRIRYRRRCESCDSDVDWADVGRAVESGFGTLVEVEPSETNGVPLPERGTVALEGFVPRLLLDPLWIHASYYLSPDQAEGPYRLLAEALRSTRRVGIGRVAFGGLRERLCAVVARGRNLAMYLLHFPAEVGMAPQVPAGETSERELALAVRLVRELDLPMDLRGMKNEARAALEQIAASKVGHVAPGEGPSLFLADLERMIAEIEQRRGA